MQRKSERFYRFARLLQQYSKLNTDELIAYLKNSAPTQGHNYLSPLARVALLRTLIGKAPLEVTKGRVYLESRTLVRTFYQV